MSTTRTNIELDDEILERAMQLYGTRTKKETVDLALRRLVGAEMTREEALSLAAVWRSADVLIAGSVRDGREVGQLTLPRSTTHSTG